MLCYMLEKKYAEYNKSDSLCTAYIGVLIVNVLQINKYYITREFMMYF